MNKRRTTSPRLNRKDWRSLPAEQWNVATFHAYFADMNREMYGADYAPMRNWSFEQGALKRSIGEHGPELLRAAFDECFHTYRPTREYPLLTAGFAVSYRINAVIPKLKAEIAEKARAEAERAAEDQTDYDALRALL